MPAAVELHIKGQKELDKAFRELNKDVLAEMKPALLKLAEPVRSDAEQLAFGAISNIGDKWGKMRVGVTIKGVYVAPKTRGRSGERRSNLAGLLMDEAMQPALDAHKEQIWAAMNVLVDIQSAKETDSLEMARDFIIQILGDADQFGKEFDKAAGKTRKFGKAAGVAGLAIAGGLTVALTKSVSAAMDSQRVNAQTESTLKALGISYKSHGKEIDNVIQKTSKLAAIDDEELQGAFNDLVRSGGNVQKALKDTALAANISRGAHIDLAKAEKLILSAETGRVAGLQKYVGILPKITTEQDKVKASLNAYKETHKHMTQAEKDRFAALLVNAKAEDKAATARNAIAVATQKYTGASEAYGKTAQGATDRMKVSIENLEESLGKLLLPTVEAVASAVSKMADFFEKHTTITKLLVVAVGALAATLISVGIATKLYAAGQAIASAATGVWTAAQWLLNAALTANPIGLVVLAIGALVVALVEAWKHSETFRKIVTAAFDAVKTAAVATFDWVKDHWPLLLGIITGPIGLAVVEVIKHWDTIRDSVKTLVSDIAHFFTSLPGRIVDAIGGAMDDLKKGLQHLFSWEKIVRWIKDALGFGSPSPHFMAIGHDMVSSMVKGVGDAAGLLKDAVGRLAKDVIQNAPGALTSGLNAVGGAIGIGGGGGGGGGGLDARVSTAVAFARSHGWHGQVTSGFRTYQEQAALYQRYLRGGPLAAKPGTSSHERGEAVDVTDYTTFGRIMQMLPSGLRLYNHLGAIDPVHYSVSGYKYGGVVPGMIGAPQLAVVHGGETITPPGQGGEYIIHNVIQLDGKVAYESWKKQAARDVKRNGGTGIRS